MNTTRERILSEGLHLVSRSGLAGITLGVLAQESGVSKSGLFAHFGSKEEVQLQLLAETARVAASTYIKKAMSQPPGLAQLRSLVEGWLGWSDKAGLRGGCPVAAGMFELDDAELTDPLRKQLVAMENEWRRMLVDLVKEAVIQKELRSDLDAEQFAWELCGIYLAHHTSQRFIKDPHATRRALTAFEGLIQRSGPVRKTKRKHAAA